jgi:hypothetical protein
VPGGFSGYPLWMFLALGNPTEVEEHS